MNFLQLAYEQGVKHACDEAGLDYAALKQAASMPPPIPAAALKGVNAIKKPAVEGVQSLSMLHDRIKKQLTDNLKHAGR